MGCEELTHPNSLNTRRASRWAPWFGARSHISTNVGRRATAFARTVLFYRGMLRTQRYVSPNCSRNCGCAQAIQSLSCDSVSRRNRHQVSARTTCSVKATNAKFQFYGNSDTRQSTERDYWIVVLHPSCRMTEVSEVGNGPRL